RVLVIGGSRGMTGAPRLAALGALRAGAGLVHLALPGGAAHEAGGAPPEFMTRAIGRGPFFTADDVEAVLALMEAVRPQAMALGPGLGRDAGTAAMVRALLARPSRPPCVVDADALYALRPNASAGEEDPSGLLSPSDIITPHPGEAAALLPERFFAQRAGTDGRSAKGVQDRRPDALAALIEACGAVVALKGAGTLVGRRGKPVVLCPTATAALAVGGSGDVLAGVIAAKAASGMASFDAACLGVHLHARAGELLENRAPGGHLAGEIASAVPLAWKELCAP
ncbi:MAG: NAD(P)H-hydrate dehydratase, partial [Desulfovibrio sp.]|nr:NAD(P)H-hydrate dehydratase [Desulfovibrio sp.]